MSYMLYPDTHWMLRLINFSFHWYILFPLMSFLCFISICFLEHICHSCKLFMEKTWFLIGQNLIYSFCRCQSNDEYLNLYFCIIYLLWISPKGKLAAHICASIFYLELMCAPVQYYFSHACYHLWITFTPHDLTILYPRTICGPILHNPHFLNIYQIVHIIISHIFGRHINNWCSPPLNTVYI